MVFILLCVLEIWFLNSFVGSLFGFYAVLLIVIYTITTTSLHYYRINSTSTTTIGVAHNAYENDVVALRGMREIFDYLPLNNKDTPEPRPTQDSRHRVEPSLR